MRKRFQTSTLLLAALLALGCSEEEPRPSGLDESMGSTKEDGSGGAPAGVGGEGGASAENPNESTKDPSPLRPTDPPEKLCESDIRINSRNDLDVLVAAGCDTIDGDLLIGTTWQGNALTSLDGLQQLKTVAGQLHLTNLEIEDLSGLEGLTQVGDLTIAYCNEMRSLTGLEKLESIDGDLTIAFNLRLLSLAPLDTMAGDAVSGSLSIHNNALLPQCAADALLEHLDANCVEPVEQKCELLNEGSALCD